MRFLFVIIFIFSVCTVQAKNDIKYTGYEIGNRYKLLQSFIADYEVENGGPILDGKVSIYKTNKNKCFLVSKIDGDSGVYGTETILYFYNSKVLYGYYVNYNYIFLNGEGSIKLNKVNYENPESENSLIELKKEFSRYISNISKNTLRKCSN